jgi:dimeric dUTPase (all-alpha-NTP-PPase superfamily)
MNPGKLIEMFQLQDKMNRAVNPDWINAGYDWSRAIYVESAELLDHIGWKWWKHQEMDLEQAQLEFVDIWHFVLSHILSAHNGDVQAATNVLLDNWTGGSSMAEEAPIQRLVEIVGSVAWLDGQVALNVLFEIAQRLELTDALLFELYVGKNALNHFRQKHGYKDGTYLKMWGGLEDNVVLSALLIENPGISYDPLMALLDEAYAEAKTTQDAN